MYGLYLEGAGWDRRNSQLCDSTPKVLHTSLPLIHLFAINSTGDRDKKLYRLCRSTSYHLNSNRLTECPIYRKPRRTDLEFVTMVELRTAVAPEKWVMRGVALLCDIK